MASGASAAPGRPLLRRTPSSWGKPSRTARPGLKSAGSPFQRSTASTSRGSSARGRMAPGSWAGSRSDHTAALDNSPDMVDPEVIKEMPIIGDITNKQVRLFPDLDGPNAIGPPQRRSGVQSQAGYHLGGQHFH